MWDTLFIQWVLWIPKSQQLVVENRQPHIYELLLNQKIRKDTILTKQQLIFHSMYYSPNLAFLSLAYKYFSLSVDKHTFPLLLYQIFNMGRRLNNICVLYVHEMAKLRGQDTGEEREACFL